MSLPSTCLQRLDDEGAFAAVQVFTDLPDALAAATGLHAFARSRYWDHHDLPGVVVFNHAAIQHALTAAGDGATDPDQADALRGIAKEASYDLASFTWPGWAEPGIAPRRHRPAPRPGRRPTQPATGPRTRPRRPGPQPGPLGAGRAAPGSRHCSRPTQAARASFDRAARHAEDGGHEADRLLHTGYAALVDALAGRPDHAFREVTDRLRDGVPGGPGFADQLDTARRVFATGRLNRCRLLGTSW